MGGCAAFGCLNRGGHGVCFKVFPKDLQRRELWTAQMNRKNWTSTENSRLCEMHFAPSMWEVNREDGKKKLKANAVPTIFPNQLLETCTGLPTPRKRSGTSLQMVQKSGKRKLRADAIPSFTPSELTKPLPPTALPSKVFSNYTKCKAVAKGNSKIPSSLTPEASRLEGPTTPNAAKQVAECKMVQDDGGAKCATSKTVGEIGFTGRKQSTVTNKTKMHLNKRKRK